VASYRFEYQSADGAWQYIGEEEVKGGMSSREAFDRLVTSQNLPAGEYRYKRSDESSSHSPGHFTLTSSGSISAE
jgi:hypothetical protein